MILKTVIQHVCNVCICSWSIGTEKGLIILDLPQNQLLNMIRSEKTLLSELKIVVNCQNLLLIYFYREIRVKNQCSTFS